MQHVVITLVLVTYCASCPAAELKTANPLFLTIGQSTEVILQGSDLAIENNEDARVWTSFPAEWKVVAGKGRDRNRLTVRITPAANATTGIGAIRAYNSQGISQPVFVWIERLSIAPSQQQFERKTAQELKLPAAVVGATPDRRLLFYRFRAQAGQTLSAEVVGQRIGIDIDPVITLLDEAGRALMFSDDDPVLAGDCRLSVKIPTTGTYYLSLHDLQYRGGRPFSLRIGHFPIPVNVYPLGVSSRTKTTVQAVDLVASAKRTLVATADPDAPDEIVRIAGGDKSFSSVRVYRSRLPQYVESEPNGENAKASAVALPAAISGRFLTSRDMDVFKFSARQGQRLTISPKTRSLHSPANLRMQLSAIGGGVVFDSRDSGLTEAVQRTRIPQDGEYLLTVSDLLGGSGPDHGYHLLLETERAPFSLSMPYDKKLPRHRPLAVPGGVLLVPLKIQRYGYQGPLQLSATMTTGSKVRNDLRLTGDKVAAGGKDASLRIYIPADAGPVSRSEIVVNAAAEIDGVGYSTTLDVRSLIQQDFPQLPLLPVGAGGDLSAVIVPPPFSAAAESIEVVRGANAELPVSLKWLGPRREPVTFAPFNLPPHCRLEKIKKLDAKIHECRIKFLTTDATPAGKYDNVYLEAVGRMHGKEFRIEVPFTITVREKKAGPKKAGAPTKSETSKSEKESDHAK